MQAYFAAHPLLRKAAIAVLGATYVLCWPAVMLLGGCEHTRGLPLDLQEAQQELRRPL